MAYGCHWLSTDRIIPRSVLVLSLVWFELTVLPLHYDASSVVHIVLGWQLCCIHCTYDDSLVVNTVLGWQLCCIHCTYDDSFVRVGVAVWIWKSSSESDKNFPRFWVLMSAGELSYISELTYQRISTANNRRGKCYFSSLPSVKDTQWGCFTSLAGNVDLIESIWDGGG